MSQSTGNGFEANSVRPDLADRQGHRAIGEIDRAIEQIGAQYVAHLRSLSGELGRLVAGQAAAKDERIAELTGRLAAAERERDALRDRLIAMERLVEAHASDLRRMSEQLAVRRDEPAVTTSSVLIGTEARAQ